LNCETWCNRVNSGRAGNSVLIVPIRQGLPAMCVMTPDWIKFQCDWHAGQPCPKPILPFQVPAVLLSKSGSTGTEELDGSRAFDHVRHLVELGPCPSGLDGIRRAQPYLRGTTQDVRMLIILLRRSL